MKNLTPIHESSHAVLAYLSKYHSITKNLYLISKKTGDIFISLSRNKVQNSDKSKLTCDELQNDKDVIEDLSMILLAGYEAEKNCFPFFLGKFLACKKYSKNNINMVKKRIKVISSQKDYLRLLKKKSCEKVLVNWNNIVKLSDIFVSSKKQVIEASEIIDVLRSLYST